MIFWFKDSLKEEVRKVARDAALREVSRDWLSREAKSLPKAYRDIAMNTYDESMVTEGDWIHPARTWRDNAGYALTYATERKLLECSCGEKKGK